MAKIMVVDDEPDIIILIELIFKNTDHTIIGASSGEKAVEKLKDEIPDLILLDILGPVSDGWQTFERIRKMEEAGDVPVAIFTAGAITFELFKRNDLNEFVDYISKPFDSEYLKKKVEEILVNHERIREVKGKLTQKGLNFPEYESVARGYNIRRTLIDAMKELLEKKKRTKEELKSFKRILEKEENIMDSLKRIRMEIEESLI